MDKLRNHYSMENPASIYDEEAMTALELAGRIAKKLNEAIELVNDLELTVGKVVTQIIPEAVVAEVEKQINDGTFDGAISEYLGDLEKRVDNILGSVKEGSTTLDAELIDIRLGFDGLEHVNAGTAVRRQIATVADTVNGIPEFEVGNIESADGSNFPIAYRLRTVNALAIDSVLGFSVNPGYSYKIFEYDKDMGFEKCSDTWVKAFDRATIGNDTKYIRALVQKDDSTNAINVDAPHGFTVHTVRSTVFKDLMKLLEIVPTWEQGTISSEHGGELNRTNRIRTVEYLPAEFSNVFVRDFKQHFICFECYDADKVFIGSTNFNSKGSPQALIFEGTKYIRVMIRRADDSDLTPDEDTGFTMYGAFTSIMQLVRDLEGKANGEGGATEPPAMAPGWFHEQMNIAYSEFAGYTIANTAEHFRFASHVGFNALKGDVRITSDNGLIMCHDAGFTLNGDGEIMAFDANNNTPISSLPYEATLLWKYANYVTGSDKQNVCSFDEYLDICKEENRIAYITLRDEKIPETVEAVYNALVKHAMINRAMINSYTLETLEEVRKYSKTIPVSMVIPHGEDPTVDDVFSLYDLGNSCLTVFFLPLADESDTLEGLLNKSVQVLDFMKKAGNHVHLAQVNNYTDYCTAVGAGISGMHITQPILPYTKRQYNFTVNGATKKLTNAPGTQLKCGYITANTTDYSLTINDIGIDHPKFNTENHGAYFLKHLLSVLPYSITAVFASSTKVSNAEAILSTSNPTQMTIYSKVNDVYGNFTVCLEV